MRCFGNAFIRLDNECFSYEVVQIMSAGCKIIVALTANNMKQSENTSNDIYCRPAYCRRSGIIDYLVDWNRRHASLMAIFLNCHYSVVLEPI